MTGNSNWPTTTDNPDGSPTLGFAPVNNGATTTLSGVLTSGATTVPATSTTLFLSSGSISIEDEVISYTSTTGTSFLGCTRGVDGTTAVAHSVGAYIDAVPIAANQNDLAQAIYRLQRALGYGTHRVTVNVLDYGADPTGVSDSYAAINSAIASLSASGGIVEFPPGVYLTSDTILIGNGTPTTESTVHGITLKGAGSGVGAGESGTQSDGATSIKCTGGSWANKALIKVQGVIHNIHLSGLQLNCNYKAYIGVQTVHAYRFTYSDVYVRLWSTIAWDFNTQTGVTSFAIGCGAGSLYDCGCQEPALTTAHAMKMDGNDTTVLDCARIHLHQGSYNFGSDAAARGLWLRFADNCFFYGPLFWTVGSGDQLYLEQATNTAYPGGNKFFPPVITKIGGTSGTGGNLFVGWLSDVDPPRLANCTFITEQGKTWGLKEIASSGSIASSTALVTAATVNQKTDNSIAGDFNTVNLELEMRSGGTFVAVGGDGCIFTFRHRFAGATAGLVAVSGLAAGTYSWRLTSIYVVINATATNNMVSMGTILQVETQLDSWDGSRRPGSTLSIDLTAAIQTDARNSISVAAGNSITTTGMKIYPTRRNRTN